MKIRVCLYIVSSILSMIQVRYQFLLYCNHGQNIVDKFTKFSKIDVSLECFTADFLQFSSTTVQIGFWVTGCRLAINSKIFRDYLKIFFIPKILSLGIWPLQGKQKPSCFAIFFLVYDMDLFFFCIVYIFYISVLAPARSYLLSLGDRGSQAKCRLFAISYIYKCYLTTPACQSSALGISVHFHVCWKLFIKFLHIVFCFLYIPKVFLKKTLMFFAGYFLVARVVF